MSNNDLIRNTEPGPHGTVLEPGVATSDLVQRLRTRYECTAGFTRNIYLPEDRDLDLLAADALERERRRADEAEALWLARTDDVDDLQSRLDAIVAMAREQRATWDAAGFGPTKLHDLILDGDKQ